jgi:cell shape-determining protein MreC
MLFIWGLLGGLICLFAPPSLTSRLQLAYTYVFSWPLQAGRNLSLATTVPPLTAVDDSASVPSQAECEQLKKRIANLEAQLREAHAQNDQLARLHTLPLSDRMAFVLADITVAHVSQGDLFINRGQQDGVAVGQYVVAAGQHGLTDSSVIGTVSDVSPQRARVKLITSPTSRLPVTIGKSDLARVMEGRLGETAKIPLVPATHAIRKDDAVYARKTPGLLDVPIIVGRIAQCRPDPKDPSVWDIAVQPACKIDALTSVAVIAASPKQE